MKKIFYSVFILLAVSCTKFDDALYDSSPIAKQSIGPVYKELADLIDDNGWWFWAQEVSVTKSFSLFEVRIGMTVASGGFFISTPGLMMWMQ